MSGETPRKKRKLSCLPYNERKLSENEWNALNEKYSEIMADRMFVHGDSCSPLKENVDMMMGILQQQLQLFLSNAMDSAKLAGHDKVCIAEAMFCFRRHKVLTARLLNHFRTAHSLRSVRLEASGGVMSKGEEEESEASEESDQEAKGINKIMAVASGSRDLLESIEDAIKAFEGGCFSVDDLSESMKDAVKEGRGRRMVARVSRMDVDMYRRFTEARQRSFVSQERKKNGRPPIPKVFIGLKESEQMLAWLDRIATVRSEVVPILDWVAREIVAQMMLSWSRVQSILAYFAPGAQQEHFRYDIMKNPCEGILASVIEEMCYSDITEFFFRVVSVIFTKFYAFLVDITRTQMLKQCIELPS